MGAITAGWTFIVHVESSVVRDRCPMTNGSRLDLCVNCDIKEQYPIVYGQRDFKAETRGEVSTALLCCQRRSTKNEPWNSELFGDQPLEARSDVGEIHSADEFSNDRARNFYLLEGKKFHQVVDTSKTKPSFLARNDEEAVGISQRRHLLRTLSKLAGFLNSKSLSAIRFWVSCQRTILIECQHS